MHILCIMSPYKALSKHSYVSLCYQEQAYAHKYPLRDMSGWQDKALKYKPGNNLDGHDIPVGPLVRSLSAFLTQ